MAQAKTTKKDQASKAPAKPASSSKLPGGTRNDRRRKATPSTRVGAATKSTKVGTVTRVGRVRPGDEPAIGIPPATIATAGNVAGLPDPAETLRRLDQEAQSVDLKAIKRNFKWNTIKYALKDLVVTGVIVGLGITVLWLVGLVIVFAFGA